MRAINETDHSRYTPEISIKTRKYGGRPVIWKDLVGIDLQADNTLVKTASYGGDNGGAASDQILPAGTDGWVEMIILETDKMRYLGLSVSDETGVGFAKMDYALQFSNYTPHVNVFENGNRIGYAGFTPNYEPGEVFAIERKGTTIYYKRNGKTFYTSTVPSTTDLAVDVCILHPEGTIHGARINFGQAPVEPGNLSASLSAADQVRITWEDRADNETGFEIERSLSAGSGYTLIHTATANEVSYMDSGLAANTTYYYRVRAVNENAGSAYVAEISITLPSGMKPLADLVQNRPVD